MRIAFTLAVSVAALVGAIPGIAQATTAIDYNVLVRNNFTSSGSDTEGWIAAGGNINVGGYAIGANKAAGAGSYAAVAGGTFTGNYGSSNGSILASSYSGPYTVNNGGSAVTYSSGATSPISIGSEITRLAALSQDMHNNASSYGTVGSYELKYSQLFLTGTSSGVNVFNIAASDLSYAQYGINFSTPSGSITVLNISGLSASLPNTGGTNYTQGNSSNVLFNFYQATSLSLASSYGSILATSADVTANNGAINCQLFANSYSGNTQINYAPLALPTSGPSTVNLLARTVGVVPEPSSWALMVTGFGLIGGALRRSRRSAVAAA